MGNEPPFTYYSDGYEQSNFPGTRDFRVISQQPAFTLPPYYHFNYRGLERNVEVYLIGEEGEPELVCGMSSLL